MPAATAMDVHSAETAYTMEARRSHSYDESFLYYGEGQQAHHQQRNQDHPPLQTSKSAGDHRRPPLFQQQQREGPPWTSRDDIALGTTVVSPLGRFRAQYEQQQQQQHGRPLIPTVSPTDDAESVPFDQQSDDDDRHHHFNSKPRVYHPTLSSDRSAKPFDEESQGPMVEEYRKPVIQSRVHGPHRSPINKETDLSKQQQFVDPRFHMPPVRVSKPALDAGVEDEDAPHDEQTEYDSEPPSLQQHGKHHYQTHLSPGSMLAHPSGSPMRARMRGIDDAYEEFGNASTKGNTTEEDDSLFDFGGKQRQKQQQQQANQNRRNAKKKFAPTGGDETSEDGGNEPCTSLALRTQEAWKRKSARQPKNSNNTPADEQHVSFSATNPLIHRYNENATEVSTLAGASLNSEYTKSMESEVEDAIKDIFLIGSGTGNNPGRRKLNRPDMRRRLRWEHAHPDDDNDDDTIESDDDDGAAATSTEKRIVVHGGPKANNAKGKPSSNNDNATSNKNSRAIIRNITPRDEKKDTEGDALLGAWTVVESGLQAVGAALGIDGGDDETEMTFDDSRQGYDSETIDTDQRKPSPRQTRGKTSKSARTSSMDLSSEYSGGGQSRSSAEGEPPSAPTPKTTEKKSPTAEGNLFDYWSSALLGNPPKPVANDSSGNESSSKGIEARRSSGAVGAASKNSIVSSRSSEKQERTLPSLDKDLRLIELAVQSARSYHKMKGLVYDESDVDIVTDIKFIVVDLSLPLGLIFQENESGCWVTKVLTDGSAIKKSIQVGDQLAAIDGKSAIRLNVEDIAVAIRQKKSRPFELTFLRYIGPLRPASSVTEEEGYEVKARLTAAESEQKARGRQLRKEKGNGSTRAAVEAATDEQDVEDSPTREKRRFRFFGRKK
eukprot:scaffold620_cov169-Amphora_coffeaeformis.AAC.3